MRLLKRKARKPEGCGKLELERVIGLTTTSASGLSCNPSTGELAYLAGAVVVVYNVKTNCQTRFLMAPKSVKAFTCIAYSGQGGRLLAAGESGHQPGVIVWEVAVGTCVAELRTHKHGVSNVQFSPNGKHLVSVGVPNDGHVCLWDWRSGTLLAKSRASTASQPACALQFASDGSFFVTGGIRHLKHWVIGLPKARSAGGNGAIGMEGKTVKLGSQKDSSFVAILSAPPSKDATTVTPDFQPLYALSAAGILCLLHCGLAIEKWVDLKVRHGYALAISDAHVGCACSDGIVRVFMHGSLAYAVTLPRPAPYGYHGLTDANVGASLAVGNRTQPGIRFPDAIACSFLQEGHTLAVIYGDHSLLVWDVQSFSKIGRYRTLLSHNSCIWDVSLLPTPQQAPALQLVNEKDCSPAGAFVTCSADGSIRLWNLGSGQEKSSVGLNAASPPTARPANIYSKDVLGVLYMDNRGDQKEKNANGATDEEFVDSLHGFRTICASPDGQHLAAGDRNGNLRIYDLNTLQLISFKEAHNGELLSLSFTSNTTERLVDEPVCMPLLASGGRDRLIHVYDVNRGYDVVETLDDHSASVTTVKFACSGSKLLSCSADKTVVFRNVAASGAGCKSTRYHQELSPRGTFYDIDTDPCDKLAVAVGQDKKLSVLNLTSGKTVRYLKPEGDVGEPFKVRLDPSGMYVVCSHSDRIMRVYDFLNGELLAHASGHAEIITGMIFLSDCRRLVSVSGDSCIFIWRLPLNMSRCMRKRCIANAESRPPPRCLQSAPTQSPGRVESTISNPRRLDQAIPFDPLDVKTKEVNHKDRKESSGPMKHGEGIFPPAIVNDSSYKVIDRPHTEPGECKKRFGRDGYRAISEARREAGHSVASSNIRSYPAEDLGTNVLDNTSESQALQHEGSPMLSAQDTLRREPHWKTVHTVFFGENDYSHDEPTSTAGPRELATCDIDRRNRASNGDISSNTMNNPLNILEEIVTEKLFLDTEKKNLQTTFDSEDEDGVVTEVSDDGEGAETHESVVVLDKTRYSDAEGEKPERAGTCDGTKSGRERIEMSSRRGQSLGSFDAFTQETLDRPAQSKQVGRNPKQDNTDGEIKRIPTLESPKISIDTELIKDNDAGGDDDGFQSCKELFSGRFHKLATNRKVEELDRSSFSTRFFARTDSSHPHSPWFDTLSTKPDRVFSGTETQALLQEDDLENNPGRLLAAERERLKLRERQDKMAIEVQRMRERLVNLGIAVAEIAHDGDSTDRKWDGEDKFSEYTLPLESPSKRSAFAAAEFRESCMPSPPSEPPGSAQYGAKIASNFFLHDRIGDGTESVCLDVVDKKNCNGLPPGESYSLGAAAPCTIGTPRTPRTPSSTHKLRNLDGRKIDLWQIKAREDPEGRKEETVEEEEEIPLAAQIPIIKLAEKPVDKQGTAINLVPSIFRPIKIPSKAELGRVLAHRGERNVAERLLTTQGHNPCSRATGPLDKSLETDLAERKENETVVNHKDTMSSLGKLSPTFGRELISRENILPNSEEGNRNEELRPDGHHSSIERKTDNHASKPTCTFPSCKETLSSSNTFEESNLGKREMSHQPEAEIQGDAQLIRTQRLFGRCKSVDINEFLGEIPGVEAHAPLPGPSFGTLSEEHYTSTPSLPRPVEDYQKSLYDLMEAADRASSLFGEVRTVCRRTTNTPSEAPCTTSTSLSPDILSISRTYQRLLPGTLQTVQRLADEAAACGLPCSKAMRSVDDDSLNNFSPALGYNHGPILSVVLFC
ncbi:hypothetical protein M758_4G185700 [Ceratodon purpureus]|nr:hypothetical protein M758_4G185700 [Ceratodon purpureus]